MTLSEYITRVDTEIDSSFELGKILTSIALSVDSICKHSSYLIFREDIDKSDFFYINDSLYYTKNGLFRITDKISRDIILTYKPIFKSYSKSHQSYVEVTKEDIALFLPTARQRISKGIYLKNILKNKSINDDLLEMFFLMCNKENND